MKKDKLIAEEVIAKLMKDFEESEHLQAYVKAHEEASKGEMTEAEKQSAIEGGKKILEKFNPFIINMVNIINDPDNSEILLEKLLSGAKDKPKGE